MAVDIDRADRDDLARGASAGQASQLMSLLGGGATSKPVHQDLGNPAFGRTSGRQQGRTLTVQMLESLRPGGS